MALVLTRRRGEKIMIGDDVVVEVMEIDGGKVRLGITAPQEVAVHRREIWQKLRDEVEDARRREDDHDTGKAGT